MKVYLCYQITETEYCGAHVVAVFEQEEDAKKFVEENQETFMHWSDREYEKYYYEEWEVI